MTAGQIRDITALDVTEELVCQRIREASLKNLTAVQNPLLSGDGKRTGFLSYRPFNNRHVAECRFKRRIHSLYRAESENEGELPSSHDVRNIP